jgi:hypothetical protein
MITGIRIDEDGTLTVVTLDNTSITDIAAGIRKQVGCEVFDLLRLPDRIDMWIDDEGLYRANINPVASAIGHLHETADVICGPVLFLSSNGDALSLTDEQRGDIALWFRYVTTIRKTA